jgi:hypothetical protein
VPVGQLVAHMSGDSPPGASAGSDSGSLDAKLKHLEFIQGVIARMSNSSFLFKGWAIRVWLNLDDTPRVLLVEPLLVLGDVKVPVFVEVA